MDNNSNKVMQNNEKIDNEANTSLNNPCTEDSQSNNQCESNNENEKKKQGLAKETLNEFLRSLLIGGIPVGIDYFFSALIIFLFALQGMGYSFIDTFSIDSGVVSSAINAAGTAVGYFMGFIAAYLLSVFFVFKNTKKGKTLKGILIFIGVEVFIYGFNVLLGAFLPKILPYTFAFIVRICVSYVLVFTLRKFLIFMPDNKKA